MLIHALCDYYEILRKRGKVRPEGYSQVGISYLISLSSDGKIADIIDYQVTDTSEKKPKPRKPIPYDFNITEFRKKYGK